MLLCFHVQRIAAVASSTTAVTPRDRPSFVYSNVDAELIFVPPPSYNDALQYRDAPAAYLEKPPYPGDSVYPPSAHSVAFGYTYPSPTSFSYSGTTYPSPLPPEMLPSAREYSY